MLALPLQRIVAIDSAPIFRGFVNKSFGAGANERFEVDIRGFQNARDTALNVTQSTDESGLNYVLHMVYQLRNMAPRFAEYETELMICYTYYDAFKPTRKITSRTLFYDLSVFLWNYAALHSHVGSRIDRSSDEGIKVAQRHYQYAAGALDCIVIECLHRMKDSTGANFGPINVGVINMCKELMLAQGQLCFYEKAVKDRKVGLMKPAIIAKLAAQTAIFYKSAAEMSKQGSCAAYVDESWGVHAEFQHRCFNAAAEYWMSQSEKEAAQSKGAGYGIEIARLNKAEIMQQDAINFATKNKLGVSSTNGAASLLRTVTSAKNTAVHDNRTVYMESVPAEGSLTAVSAVSLVKPSEPPEYGGGEKVKSFFTEIQPKALKGLITSTKETLDALQLEASTLANNATNDGRKKMSSVGLPGSLETYMSGGQFPHNLWVEIQRVQTLGGVEELDARNSHLEESAGRSLVSIGYTDDSIAREEKVDSSFRNRFPEWGGATVVSGKATPSSVLNADIKVNIARLRDALDAARRSDSDIKKELTDPSFLKSMKYFTCSREELMKLLPTPSSPLVDLMNDPEALPGSVDTSYLKQKLLEMAHLIDDREALVKELTEYTSADINDFSTLVKASDKKQNQDPADIISQHLAAAQDVGDRITSSVISQDDLLKEILTGNENFVRARKSDPVTVQRDAMIQILEQGASRFFTIHSQLTAGATFYSNLQSRLTSLLQSSDDLAYTQQLTRQEFEEAEAHKFLRRNQENEDREFALRLSDELKNPNGRAAVDPSHPPPKNPRDPSVPAIPGPEVGAFQYSNVPATAPASAYNPAYGTGPAPAYGSAPQAAPTYGSAPAYGAAPAPAYGSAPAPAPAYANAYSSAPAAATAYATSSAPAYGSAPPYNSAPVPAYNSAPAPAHAYANAYNELPRATDGRTVFPALSHNANPNTGMNPMSNWGAEQPLNALGSMSIQPSPQDQLLMYQNQQLEQERQHQLELKQQQQQFEQKQQVLQQQYQMQQLEQQRIQMQHQHEERMKQQQEKQEKQRQEQQQMFHQYDMQRQQNQPVTQPAAPPSYEYNGSQKLAPNSMHPPPYAQPSNNYSFPAPAVLPPIQHSRPSKHPNPKVNRLVEMGFTQERVVAMLAVNKDDEDAALNSLLSES